jgi:chemotaxis protein CheD
MGNTINIKTAELAASHNDDIIKTGSIGSCVVISLYDPDNKIGGLAHAMLPSQKHKDHDHGDVEAEAKYADKAVDNLISEIRKKGGKKDNLIAKLIGGASMFKHLSSGHSIGKANIESAHNRLQELGIKVESEDTGGTTGKLVEMDLRNGMVKVNTVL